MKAATAHGTALTDYYRTSASAHDTCRSSKDKAWSGTRKIAPRGEMKYEARLATATHDPHGIMVRSGQRGTNDSNTVRTRVALRACS